MDNLIQEALDWVNSIRTEFNLETLDTLPRGVLGDGVRCSLGRALSDLSDGSRTFETYGGRSAPIELPLHDNGGLTFCRNGEIMRRAAPPRVLEFVRALDAGLYPQLVEGWEIPIIRPLERELAAP